MAKQDPAVISDEEIVDSAVAQGGAYEVIRKRLVEQGKTLGGQALSLNEDRVKEFGGSDMAVLGRARVRTENNCIARDIVQVGDQLLFGYNVFIGLKKETKVEDVFALFKAEENAGDFDLAPQSSSGSFLSDVSFVNDFTELYRYYKHTKLIQLRVANGKLLAGFQIGERLEDIRVFRWLLAPDGSVQSYIDNRGERDIQLPPAYDFEWVATSREDVRHGRHPHVNILDTVFVETINGDLTIKIEDNTEDGLGIYREPVEDESQSLDDAQIHYAAVGGLILLKVRPYGEEHWRYLIYNTLTQTALRVDALGQSCVQLPEDHGIIYPGGYYLQTGEHKSFSDDVTQLKFKRLIRSPNGEDFLYVFYEPEQGVVGLFAYNMIEKRLSNPILCHGYALADNGRLVIFNAEGEPTRVHPMQLWQTPYVTDEFASRAPDSQTFCGRIGNAEMVRGISDLYSVVRMIDNQSVSSQLYAALAQAATRIFDDHFWVADGETAGIAETLRDIAATAELVIDEFEKVKSIRQQSSVAMQEAEVAQEALLGSIRPESWEAVEEYVSSLSDLRRQRGHLATIREYRYIDLDRIDTMHEQLQSAEESLSQQTVNFLTDEKSLSPYLEKICQLNTMVEGASTIVELKPAVETIEITALGLDLLSELLSTLKVEDATVHTRIIDGISSVYAKLNQCKATANHKRKNLGSEEAIAQFGARFKLFSQSITNALAMADTPEKCDEQLSRLLVQLEELESQFSDFDQFLSDIIDKREEVYESFEGRKQQLLDDRQRKAQSVSDAAQRILASIEKRSLKLSAADDLNTYFSSDALVMKVGDMVQQLRDLDSAIKADDIESRFKSIKEQALRSLRDKADIYEQDGAVIKLGTRHRFSVNTQELDLAVIPRNGELSLHLTGTDFYERIDNADLLALSDYWGMSLESESTDVYRGEYLAVQIIEAAQAQAQGQSWEKLGVALLDDAELGKLVQEFAAPRYKDGYERGVHDHDAVLLLKALVPAIDSADLLRFDPLCRALAQVYWTNVQRESRGTQQTKDAAISHETWHERAQSAAQMHSVFFSNKAIELLAAEVRSAITDYLQQHPIPVGPLDIRRAADYLVAELAREQVEFIGSKYAIELVEELRRSMDDNTWSRYQLALEKLQGWPAERWKLSVAWLEAMVLEKNLQSLSRYIPEAVALINAHERLERRPTQTDVELSVQGLLGDHPLIENQTLSFALDSYLQRMQHHRFEVVPAYQRYLQVRQQLVREQRSALRLSEYKARPLSSFVRNKLINDSYLPLIGDNLAKQMGTVGDSKRTDLMGLLMMISPPGYGKTTLMEYVASRLGLIFMKINCPSLGHDVLSLDPQQAPNATARRELEKLNLALEMGNNVMLYLDDIQHTHAEFLQKFISLCDGTRRVEGVWKGEPKSYDMRGKKFCVVMAGNPYTESGETFKVPDMLANRADIYNLGDILSGMDEQFSLSYVENAITSHPILAPLAVREMEDIYKFVGMAQGASIISTDLSHQYSAAEINEILDIMKKMFVVREVVLKINQQYIASASQDDKYRVEPPFKLQGSYRNMNKMTEKLSAVMSHEELLQMIGDHYLGEAQLLTTGAEANLLKLAELNGNLTADEASRWEQIKRDFLRAKAMGGDDADVGGKVVAQLVDLVGGVQALADVASSAASAQASGDQTGPDQIRDAIAGLTAALEGVRPEIQVVNQPVPGMDKVLTVLAETLEYSLLPLVRSMEKKLDIDLRTHERLKDISGQLLALRSGGGSEVGATE